MQELGFELRTDGSTIVIEAATSGTLVAIVRGAGDWTAASASDCRTGRERASRPVQ